MADTTKNTQHPARPYQGSGITEYDLKSIRESKGLTLKDVFERTRISVATLAAIENGDFHLLPPPVFTKSFIKIYAKTLAIDSEVILARYEQYLETLNPTHRDVKIKEIPRSARLFYKVFLCRPRVTGRGGHQVALLSESRAHAVVEDHAVVA